MLSKALVLTDGEADLLSRALEEVKTKAYEQSETSLEDTQALNALLSIFRNAEMEGQEKKDIVRILVPYVNTLCRARLSIGKASRIPASTHKL
jgi:DNA-binding ferritin-like protein (Dps family)